MTEYRVAGLRVESELPLPGFSAQPSSLNPSDIVVRRAPVPQDIGVPSARGPTWEIAEHRLLFRVPGVARFLLTGGSEIAVELAPRGAAADAGFFVGSTVLGIALQQRGCLLLRASAVAVGNRAVLFCGPSTAGKSTLAAALTQRGYHLLGDDYCRLEADSSGAMTAQGDGGALKLWRDASKRLGMSDPGDSPLRPGVRKYCIKPLPNEPPPALEVGAIYELNDADVRPQDISPLNLLDTVRALPANAFHPLLVSRLSQQASYFAAASTLAQRGFCFLARVARRPETLTPTIERMEAHWRAIGLLAAKA